MNNNVKILIADDEERWRRLVGDFLRNEGFKTVEAANGQEAVELIRQDSDISLAILDIMMPVMDGIQACQDSARSPSSCSPQRVTRTARSWALSAARMNTSPSP